MQTAYLDTFLKTVESRSFTLAAKQLFITQQAVSKQVACLEKELQATLVERTTPLRLTPKGRIVARYAGAMLQLLQDMQAELADAAVSAQQALNVGVAHTRGKYLASSLFAAFHKRYPEVQLNLYESCNSGVYKQLLDGRLDCVIARGTPTTPGIVSFPLFSEEVVLVMADSLWQDLRRGTEVLAAMEDPALLELPLLSRCPFLLLKEGDLVRTIGDQILEESRIRPIVSAYAEHLDTLYAMCREGLGAMFCPRMYLGELRSMQGGDHPPMRWFHLANPLARYPVNLSYPANAYKNTVLHAFLDAAKGFAAAQRAQRGPEPAG